MKLMHSKGFTSSLVIVLIAAILIIAFCWYFWFHGSHPAPSSATPPPTLSVSWYWSVGDVKPYENFALSYPYNVSLSVSGAPPENSILFYLERPDGSMQYDGIVPDGIDVTDNSSPTEIAGVYETNASGTWSAATHIFIPTSTEIGTWTGWVSVNGVLSNKVSIPVAVTSSPPLPSPRIIYNSPS
jgi:hypothetical protein